MEKEVEITEEIKEIHDLSFFDSFIKAIWIEFLEPSKNYIEFFKMMEKEFRRIFHNKTGMPFEKGTLWKWKNKYYISKSGGYLPPNFINNDWLDTLHKFNSVNDYINEAIFQLSNAKDDLSKYYKLQFQILKHKVARLSPLMIDSLKDISNEYMLWLKKHPNMIEKVSWEAFEKIIAEIFSANGFHIILTGKIKGLSADIIAIKEDFSGIETRYLIECKKYNRNRKIGLNIINGVIGAKQRANFEHALLVTTSTYSKEVIASNNRFENLNLHLKDANDVIKWLSDYTPNEKYGLWMDKYWSLEN